MLGNHKIIVDEHSEVYRELYPWIDGDFWDLNQHEIVPGAVYIFCRESVNKWGKQIKQLAQDGTVTVVLDNAAEGSETIVNWCVTLGLADLVHQKKILLIGGGDINPNWNCFYFEYCLPKILDFDENIETANRSDEIFSRTQKPYKFLFLNGRMRNHRKYLLERFKLSGVLDQSLWTCLDTNLTLALRSNHGRWWEYDSQITLEHNGENLMTRRRDIHVLPARYEATPHRAQLDTKPTDQEPSIKWRLFNRTWGDALIDGEAYRDTYFSLVTETVFNYPYSFRTEKIWKPIAVGHPWIAVANRGFYKDLQNLGFKTFSHVIDESFDMIDNNQDRIERIATVVEDLCQQDLANFLSECYNVCRHNQELYAELRHQVPKEFPEKFHKFINQYINE